MSSSYYHHYYYYVHSLQTQAGCSAWFIGLGSRLQKVTTGPSSLFSSFLYRDRTFLSIFAVPNSAVFWTTSNLTFTPIRFTYSLKLTDTAPRAPITTDTTMTFRMRQAFAISSFNSWYFSNFSHEFTIFHPVITWDGNINYDNLL